MIREEMLSERPSNRKRIRGNGKLLYNGRELQTTYIKYDREFGKVSLRLYPYSFPEHK